MPGKYLWGGNVFFSHGSNHGKGVMILIRPGFDLKVERCECDKEGRYIILHAKINDQCVIMLNIYAPNTENEQLEFYKQIQLLLQEELHCQEDYAILIGGDTNLILNAYKDRKGGNFKDKIQ